MGRFVRPVATNFQAAGVERRLGRYEGFADAPGGEAYSVAATVFVIMYKKPKSPERAAVAMDFFKWSLEGDQAQANLLDYVPLQPGTLVQQIESCRKAQFAGFKG